MLQNFASVHKEYHHSLKTRSKWIPYKGFVVLTVLCIRFCTLLVQLVVSAYERGLVDKWRAYFWPYSFYDFRQTISFHWVFLSLNDESRCSLRVLSGVGVMTVNMEKQLFLNNTEGVVRCTQGKAYENIQSHKFVFCFCFF